MVFKETLLYPLEQHGLLYQLLHLVLLQNTSQKQPARRKIYFSLWFKTECNSPWWEDIGVEHWTSDCFTDTLRKQKWILVLNKLPPFILFFFNSVWHCSLWDTAYMPPQLNFRHSLKDTHISPNPVKLTMKINHHKSPPLNTQIHYLTQRPMLGLKSLMVILHKIPPLLC